MAHKLPAKRGEAGGDSLGARRSTRRGVIRGGTLMKQPEAAAHNNARLPNRRRRREA
ncbi:MAG: hypothetical protein LBD24_02465 [Spirochaetaceae bacterium]|nr:hypothetical protein [Spirochaetaceae bacterium]